MVWLAVPPPPREGFCDTLTRIVAAERLGFAPLRAGSTGDRRWSGTAVPFGFARCEVEGGFYPTATYACTNVPRRGRRGGVLDDEFDAIGDAVDACLARAAWYPADWRRGDEHRFGLGERQVTWRDIKASPKPALQLKVEEDFLRHRYLVRLAVFTLQ